MKFTFGLKTYTIEFARTIGTVPGRTLTIEIEEPDPLDPELLVMVTREVPIPKRHPSTTVRIWELTADPKAPTLFRTATVGTYHREKTVTLEKGRLRALREVCRTIDNPGFKAALFTAYHERPRDPGVPKVKAEAPQA